MSASESDWKNWPTTPRTNARGKKHEDRRQGRADDRPADLLARAIHGRVARLPFGQVPRDVLDDHHRVVDDEPDGHRQPAERHQVQRVAGEIEKDEADDEAQGNRECGDERGSEALEEQEQDEHAERTADDDGVPDVGDGRPDQKALVIDGDDPHAGRGGLRGVGEHALQVARDGERVPAESAKDGQRHGVLAVRADRHRAVLVRDRHPAQVAEPDRLAVLAGDDAVFEVQGIGGQRVGEDLVLQHLAIEPADGLEAVFLAEPIGDVGDREPRGHERLGVDLDEDLADVPALDRDVRDVGDAG